MARTTGHDRVVAALHIGDGSIILMTSSAVLACSTCMIRIGAESMGPTIKHADAVIADDWHRCRSRCSGSRSSSSTTWIRDNSCERRCRIRRRCNDSMGSMKASLLCSELALVLNIFHIEWVLKLSHVLSASAFLVHKSQATVKTPVASNIKKVSPMMASSESSSFPAMLRRLISRRLIQRFSMS